MLISSLNSSDVDLLPLNRNIIGFEDGLNGFGNLSPNTVAYIRVSSLEIGKMNEAHLLPGMSVVVYLPPNLVGLKISDCTVAIAGGGFSQLLRLGFRGLYSLQLVGEGAIVMKLLNLEGTEKLARWSAAYTDQKLEVDLAHTFGSVAGVRDSIVVAKS